MSNTPPPVGPGGQPLPPGLDPDAFSPFGSAGSQPTPPAPQSPSGPPPGPAHPGDVASEPTVVDTPAAPYQTDFQPGQPYAPTFGPVADPGNHGGEPGAWQPYAQEGQGSGFVPPQGPNYPEYDDHYAEPSNRVNPVLLAVSGLLALLVLGGGGFFFYSQIQAAKAEQAAQIAKAESEAKAAKEEAKKAQEESKKAQEAQAAAAKQAEEAEKKAAEEAAKAAEAQAAQAAQANQPAPAPAAPAAPAKRGPGVRPKIRDTEILGSGCTPGTNHLPNGTWFGFAYDQGNDVMHFDLVCLHRSGKIDNDNDKLRKLNANGFQYPESSFVGITVENGTITNLWFEGP